MPRLDCDLFLTEAVVKNNEKVSLETSLALKLEKSLI
jgi:hypothetical protein